MIDVEEEEKEGKNILPKSTVFFPPKKKKSAFKDPNSKKKKRNTTGFNIVENTLPKSVKVKDDTKRYSSKSQIYEQVSS